MLRRKATVLGSIAAMLRRKATMLGSIVTMGGCKAPDAPAQGDDAPEHRCDAGEHRRRRPQKHCCVHLRWNFGGYSRPSSHASSPDRTVLGGCEQPGRDAWMRDEARARPPGALDRGAAPAQRRPRLPRGAPADVDDTAERRA